MRKLQTALLRHKRYEYKFSSEGRKSNMRKGKKWDKIKDKKIRIRNNKRL